MKITERTTVQQNKEILASSIDGEVVMMSIKKSGYFGLGKPGSFIWENLAQPITIGELADKVTGKFEVSKEKCLKDMMPFLNDLIEKELIIATNPS